ncbi:MAG: deoxyribodipyrimidine photo-lyase [Capsulimonadales bacterium]|nr:deoxyribodipyrimidine photo-lyase [Capsulimonadales bacterium]
MKRHRIAVYWFRRIIRLDDNQALLAATAAAEYVVPVFVPDPALLAHPNTAPARVDFLFEALADIDASLRERGSRLIVRSGQPVEELARLVRETGATALFFSRDYEPYARSRDAAVTESLRELGVTVETGSDLLTIEPDEIFTGAGKPYTVFTPYKKVWWERPIPEPQEAPARVPFPPSEIFSDPLPERTGSSGTTEPRPLVHGSEREARSRLEAFLRDKVVSYDTGREPPGSEGTSRLSAYLKMGVLSARRLLAAVRQVRKEALAARRLAGGPDTFLAELAWRDFYYQILWHFPSVAERSFRPAYEGIAWENREEYFDAWRDGRTGYPIIDAAQRQLKSEAWMHNRARMITASFLTKDLLCDWRLGEAYFMRMLIDGDLAANNGGWQWAASTGTDAQPFFRIFNPVAQGERFDADGVYVRRYVPELRRVPNRFLHRPWELSPSEQEAVGCVLGRDYPYPIVDHKTQREKALALYRRAADPAAGKGQ